MRERLRALAVPIQIPWGREDHFQGMVDLVRMKMLTFDEVSLGTKMETGDIPDEMKAAAKAARETLLEAVAETDETLLNAYLDEGDLSEEALCAGIRKATVDNRMVPVLCGTSLHNQGIQPLLDAVVRSPSLARGRAAGEGAASQVGRGNWSGPTGDFEPLCSLAFKVATDPFVGKLIFMRVYSGELKRARTSTTRAR